MGTTPIEVAASAVAFSNCNASSREIVQANSNTGEFKQRNRFLRLWQIGKQSFELTDGLRTEKHIAARRADLSGDVIDYDNAPAGSDRVDHRLFLVISRASFDRAIHAFVLGCV
jgi:hypothetical protein